MRRSGTVFIGEDLDREESSMWSGRWSAYWEPAESGAAREELRGISASEAITWGRARADVVLIRPGDSVVHYSAGHRHSGGEDLPVWPEGKKLERRRDPNQAYLDRERTLSRSCGASATALRWRSRNCRSSLSTTDSAFGKTRRSRP
jgi:hypothetical protein